MTIQMTKDWRSKKWLGNGGIIPAEVQGIMFGLSVVVFCILVMPWIGNVATWYFHWVDHVWN